MRTKKEAIAAINAAYQQCRDWVAEEDHGSPTSYDLWKMAEEAERLLSVYDDDKEDDDEIDESTDNQVDLLEV